VLDLLLVGEFEELGCLFDQIPLSEWDLLSLLLLLLLLSMLLFAVLLLPFRLVRTHYVPCSESVPAFDTLLGLLDECEECTLILVALER
jgi:hypothetical protein